MKEKIPAIVIGEYISAYGAIRGLSRAGVPIYLVAKTGTGLATKSRFVKQTLKLHPAEDDYVERLNNWVETELGGEAVLIVAGDDDCLEVLSQQRDRLSPGVKTTFPAWDVVQTVREKWRTYEIAEKLGVPVPKTHYVTSEERLESLLVDGAGALTYPVFLKAEESSELMDRFGIKGVVCDNSKAVRDAYRRYDGFLGQLLIQDLIPGETEKIVTVLMSLNRNSEPTGLTINHKKRSAGQYLGGTLVVSAWNDTLLEHSLKLARGIGYVGYAGAQFKWDPRDEEFKFLEINGRMSMSNALALRCGVNLPYLMYREAIEGPLPALTEFKRNYPNDIIWWYPAKDIPALKRNGAFKAPFAYLRTLIGRGYTIEPFSWRDPYPGIDSLAMVFRDIFSRVTAKLSGRSKSK